MRLLSAFFMFLLAIGCSQSPEETSIVKKVEEIGAQVEKEIAERCGNGIQDENEKCDFEGYRSCSSIDSSLIGPMWCKDCSEIVSNCVKESTCDETHCSGNGNCYEDEYNKNIGCKCDEFYTAYNCNECAENAHFDLDGTCISDTSCTEIGCEKERTECTVIEGQATCDCINPWWGDNCDKCISTYYLENGECKGKYCVNSGFTCPNYERCDDSSGRPVCVCKYENQNPDDCSKCMPGYDWVYNSKCLDTTNVSCKTDPNAPKLSEKTNETVEITYTDENGWTEPAYCKWKCRQGAYEIEEDCLSMFRYSLNRKLFPIGVNKNGQMLAGDELEKQILYLDKNSVVKTIHLNFYLSDARLLPDGNIFFKTTSTYGIFDPDTEEYFVFDNDTTIGSPISVSTDGTVYFGNTYFSFPNLFCVFTNSSASSIISYNGDILTVFVNGDVVLSDRFKNLIWIKSFRGYSFSKYPVFDGNGNIYIPSIENNSKVLLKLSLDDGQQLKSIIINDSDYNYLNKPVVSIGTDGIKFSLSKGVLKIYDTQDQLITDTSDILDIQTSSVDYPPIVTDKGLVLFNRYHAVAYYRVSDKTINTFELPNEESPQGMVYHDNTLFVFTNTAGTYVLNGFGELDGNWSHPFHDPQLSGSREKKYEVEKPEAAVPVLPEDNHSQYPGNVIFTWDIPEDPDISYTLLIRDSTGFDKVYAGPTKGLDNFSANLYPGKYQWHVVSQNKDGALNISAKQNFEIEQE